jgi:GAF domain-containing protein
MTEPDAVVRIMGGVARVLQGASDLDEALAAAAEAAAVAVPQARSVSLWLVRRDGEPTIGARTGAIAETPDRLQRELQQGPVLDCLARHATVWSDDLGHDDRWPAYGAQATDHGIRSQLCVSLPTEHGSLGALSLYAPDRAVFDEEARMLAELCGTRAAATLTFAATVDQLNDALTTRTSIGTALGIVMERYQLDEDAAFQYLVRLSQTGNEKLRDVAHKLVDSTGRSNADE